MFCKEHLPSLCNPDANRPCEGWAGWSTLLKVFTIAFWPQRRLALQECAGTGGFPWFALSEITSIKCRLICYWIAQTALSSLWRLAVKQGSSAYWVQPSVWFRSSTGVDPPCPKTWSNYSTHFPSHFLGTCIYSQDLEVLSNFCWKPDFLHACPKHTFAFQSLQP